MKKLLLSFILAFEILLSFNNQIILLLDKDAIWPGPVSFEKIKDDFRAIE